MGGVLCIDFGTSSIRVVRRMPAGNLKVLNIGRIAKSQLDDASIRSEIHIDSDAKYVRFGERAIQARSQSDNFALFEASPKLWLKSPKELFDPAINGHSLNRATLIAGCLANAIRASIEAETLSATTLDQMELRVAHPVWPKALADQINAILRNIGAHAMQMALERDWSTVTVATLETYALHEDAPPRAPLDVVEPSAAAVEMLPSEENERRLCAVIDVGAGTTDIGLFEAVTPDATTPVRGKLYPLGSQRSVFRAGNYIDAIVLKLLKSRAKKSTPGDNEEVASRIRGVKETLFLQGFIQELGADISIDDLRAHPDARAIAQEIRAELEGVVSECGGQVMGLLDARTHSVSRLEVVMAGGGAAIDFIQAAICRPIQLQGLTLSVAIVEAEEDRDLNLYGASRGRMAVALGGASREYDELIHVQPPVTRIKRGPL